MWSFLTLSDAENSLDNLPSRIVGMAEDAARYGAWVQRSALAVSEAVQVVV